MKQHLLHYAGIVLRFALCGGLAWLWGKTALGFALHFEPSFEDNAVSLTGKRRPQTTSAA